MCIYVYIFIIHYKYIIFNIINDYAIIVKDFDNEYSNI